MGSKNLTFSERLVIEEELQNGHKPSEIAKKLGRSKSGINKEIQRNSFGTLYIAEVANYFAVFRRTKPRTKFITENPFLIELIKRNIVKYSPDVIAGRLKQQDAHMTISHESIYKIIYKLGSAYTQYLPKKHRSRKARNGAKGTRGGLKNQRNIKDRPESAKNKSRYGHLECDTIVGKDHQGAIVTANCKKSRFGFAKLIRKRTASLTLKAMLKIVDSSQRKILTFTPDNGKEFAEHEKLTEITGAQVYFADPGCPYQRGQNENFNRLLRKFFPKGTDFTTLHPMTVKKAVDEINNTPRKVLGYKTPAEVFIGISSGEIVF